RPPLLNWSFGHQEPGFGKLSGCLLRSGVVSDSLTTADGARQTIPLHTHTSKSRKEDQMPVDLRESPLGRKIKEALDKICAGNEGHAVLDELSVDTDNGIASGKARLKHQHDFGGAQLGPNTMTMKFKFDYTTGEYDGAINLGNVKLKNPITGANVIDETI